METDGVIAEITSENFQECIGGTIEEIIKNNDNNREKKMQRVDAQKREQAKNIKMDSLINIKTIAFGQFGPVYLVKSPTVIQDNS